MKMGNPQTQREILAQIDVSSIPRRHWVLEQLATGSVSCRHIAIAAILVVLMLFIITSLGSRKAVSIAIGRGPSQGHVSFHYMPSERTTVVLLRNMPPTWPEQLALMTKHARSAGAVVVLGRETQSQLLQLDRNLALTHSSEMLWVFVDVEGGDFSSGVTGQVIAGSSAALVSKSSRSMVLFADKPLSQLPPQQLAAFKRGTAEKRVIVTAGSVASKPPPEIPSSLGQLCVTLAGCDEDSKLAVLQPLRCNRNDRKLTAGTSSECALNLAGDPFELQCS